MKVRVHGIWVQDLRDVPEFEIEAESVFEMIRILHLHPIKRKDELSPYHTSFRCSWGNEQSVSLSFWQGYFVHSRGALQDEHALWRTTVRNYEVAVCAYRKEEYGQWRKAFGDESYGNRIGYQLYVCTRKIGEEFWTHENSSNRTSLPKYLEPAFYQAHKKLSEIQEWLDDYGLMEYEK